MDPPRAELLVQLVGDLVGAAPLADPLPNAEDQGIPLHFLLDGKPEGIAILKHGHRTTPRVFLLPDAAVPDPGRIVPPSGPPVSLQ